MTGVQTCALPIFSGASTDPNVDGVLAEAEAVAFRTPFFTDKNLRAAVNSGKTGYMDRAHIADKQVNGSQTRRRNHTRNSSRTQQLGTIIHPHRPYGINHDDGKKK